MNLGKPVKVVVVPDPVPARQPAQAPPQTRPEPLIPLPADWPMREPVPVRRPNATDSARP
jgi:hypothetical protein